MKGIQNFDSHNDESHSHEGIYIPNQDQTREIEHSTLLKDSPLAFTTFQAYVKSVLSSIFSPSKYEGGTVSDGILTLLAATIGTGILMIPNSMAASGVAWSIIQMIMCAVLSYYSLITVVKCACHIGAFSYQDLAQQTYGHWCRQIVNLTSFFANWGSAILYLKLISELFAVSTSIFFGHMLPSWISILRIMIWYLKCKADPESKILPVLIATIFVLPLCVSKELKALRYFCILNICFVIFFCLVVFYQGFDYQPLSESFKTVSLFTLSGFSTTFPSAVFAYMSHTNLLDVYKELHNPSMEKMNKIIKSTILFVLITYVFVGIVGYATFSSNLDLLSSPKISNGIILLAYGHSLEGQQRPYPFLVVISMITMSISIVISQPFNIKPAKDGLKNFISFSKSTKDNATESPLQRLLYILITLYSCVFVAVYSESIQMIMNIIGSSFFALICFIFPSLFYLKIFKDQIITKDKLLHYFLLLINIIFAIWNTAENISASFSKKL